MKRDTRYAIRWKQVAAISASDDEVCRSTQTTARIVASSISSSDNDQYHYLVLLYEFGTVVEVLVVLPHEYVVQSTM